MLVEDLGGYQAQICNEKSKGHPWFTEDIMNCYYGLNRNLYRQGAGVMNELREKKNHQGMP